MAPRIVGGLAVWALVAAVWRVTFLAPEDCPPVGPDQVQRSAREAVGWLVRNQERDGRWVYGYDRDDDQVSAGYNLVRHAGVAMSLYQAAAAGHPGALEAADRGVSWAERRLVRHEEWAAFASRAEPAKLGATALLAAALTLRREATGDDRHDELLAELGRFMVSQQQADGSMLEAWDPRTRAPVPGAFSPFSTGEAAWALARLDQVFPGQGWGEPAAAVTDYVATRRDAEEGRGPLYADHWAAYTLAELASGPIGLTDDELRYARYQAGAFGLRVRGVSQQQADGIVHLVRGPQPLGAGLGTFGEGLGSLWRVAGDDGRMADLRDDVALRARCLTGLLVDRQVTPEEAAAGPRPGLERGAWFAGDYTQMDDQQHALSALLVGSDVLSTPKEETP